MCARARLGVCVSLCARARERVCVRVSEREREKDVYGKEKLHLRILLVSDNAIVNVLDHVSLSVQVK